MPLRELVNLPRALPPVGAPCGACDAWAAGQIQPFAFGRKAFDVDRVVNRRAVMGDDRKLFPCAESRVLALEDRDVSVKVDACLHPIRAGIAPIIHSRAVHAMSNT